MYRNLSLEDIDGEIWKPIKGYEESYMVSNMGRIKSIFTSFTEKNGKIRPHKPRILKQHFSSTGYLLIGLFGKTFKVHRLVGEAFIPRDSENYVINHKDFNPLNNRVDNLEWTTQRENVLHAIEHHRNSAYTYPDKKQIIELYKMGCTASEIAEQLGTTKSIVHNIIHKARISRKTYRRKSKYMDLEQLKEIIQSGMPICEISKKYNIPRAYIATRKYQMKIGRI